MKCLVHIPSFFSDHPQTNRQVSLPVLSPHLLIRISGLYPPLWSGISVSLIISHLSGLLFNHFVNDGLFFAIDEMYHFLSILAKLYAILYSFEF